MGGIQIPARKRGDMSDRTPRVNIAKLQAINRQIQEPVNRLGHKVAAMKCEILESLSKQPSEQLISRIELLVNNILKLYKVLLALLLVLCSFYYLFFFIFFFLRKKG